MELFKTKSKTKMVVAAVINGETKFLKFRGKTDPYSSNPAYAAKHNNKVDNSLIAASFSFVGQNEATLFEQLTELVEVVEVDLKNKHVLGNLLDSLNIKREDVVIQNINGTDVSTTYINLAVLFSHLNLL